MRLHVRKSSRQANASIFPEDLAAVYLAGLTEGVALVSSPLLPRLPCLQQEETVVQGLSSIMAYVKEYQGSSLDASLSDLELAKCTAYMALLNEHAMTLYLATYYMEREVFDNCTRPDLSHNIPFPFNYIRPLQLHSAAKKRLLDSRGWTGVSCEKSKEGLHERMQVEATADELFSTFQNMMSGGSYIFGDIPSSLDLLLHAYLSLFKDAKSSVVGGVLHARYHTLIEWTNELQPIFASHAEIGTEESVVHALRQHIHIDKDMLRKGVIVTSGIVAMVGYALVSGRVKIRLA